jgi:hypothetical protein
MKRPRVSTGELVAPLQPNDELELPNLYFNDRVGEAA